MHETFVIDVLFKGCSFCICITGGFLTALNLEKTAEGELLFVDTDRVYWFYPNWAFDLYYLFLKLNFHMHSTYTFSHITTALIFFRPRKEIHFLVALVSLLVRLKRFLTTSLPDGNFSRPLYQALQRFFSVHAKLSFLVSNLTLLFRYI